MQDPRQAALLGTDWQLPALPPSSLSAAALRERFARSLPWQVELKRDSRRLVDRPLRPAAVLVPIVLRPSPTVLLTRRTDHLASHSGQIAFPGGKVDASDADAAAAALREAEEEVGLDPRRVELLGALPDYLSSSAYRITPVVGLVQPDAGFSPNPHEVADLFEVPLAFLMNPAHHQRRAMDWQGQRHEWLAMPYDDGGTERFIWGATAAMLRNLYRYLAARG
jgi:8-oxo-dGTP pyrophosphatase MutT (NUDIX family)